MDEQSDSSTRSANSPTADNQNEEERQLWNALSHNGHTQGPALTGEASQLLRKLITCRKLGMSITPAPPNMPTPYTDHRANFAKEMAMVSLPLISTHFLIDNNDMFKAEIGLTKTSGRRKQNYPSKAKVEEASTRDMSPCGDGEVDMDYLPDFTGNNPWCNLQIVKTKV